MPILLSILGNPIVKWILIIAGAFLGFEAFKAYQQHVGASKERDKQKAAYDDLVNKGTKAQGDVNTGSDRDKKLEKEFDRDA